MSTAQIRWGRLKTVSKDKGPYKLATFDVDGVERDVHIMEVSGIQTNPEKESIAMIICPDGDEGRMFALVMPPPSKRVDGQKEGETSFKNHVTGNSLQHTADGNSVLTTSADHIVKTDGICHINPA